ncbi:MAG: alpha/beta hydrolase [Bdellovibrionales bacterium]|nr:alpha/beta hydrolase [Bdellovibrionales bacterium]
MKQYLVDGIRLNFLESHPEKSKAIIFIHGNSHSARTFNQQIGSTALADYHLISVDLPGHGESSRLPQYSLKSFAKSILGLIHELGLEDFILVGHSLGGHICINMLHEDMNQNTKNIKPSGLFIFGTPPLKNPFDPGAFIFDASSTAIGQLHPTDEVISKFADDMNYQGDQKRIAVEDFNKSDFVFRETILDDILSGTHFDEISLVNFFDGSIKFLLATKESLINNNYIRNELLSYNDRLSIEEISAGHSPHIENSKEFNLILEKFCNETFEKKITYSTINDLNKLEMQKKGVKHE